MTAVVARAATPGRVAQVVREADAFGERQVAERDRAEEFPQEACQLLDALGVPAWYVPQRFGGALTDHGGLIRMVSSSPRSGPMPSRPTSPGRAGSASRYATASSWPGDSPSASTAATCSPGS